MRHLANIITSARILCALLLLLPGSPFLPLYVAGGLSDLLDGPAARKTGSASRRGAVLDSAADFIFLLAVLLRALPALRIPAWLWQWAVGIAAIRCISLLAGAVKYRRCALLHTWSNKATGVLLFCLPLFPSPVTAGIVCAAASLSALEELAIMLGTKARSPDVSSLPAILRHRRETAPNAHPLRKEAQYASGQISEGVPPD